MLCANCKQEVKDGDMFCPSCGARQIAEVPEQPPIAPPPSMASEQPPVTAPGAASTQAKPPMQKLMANKGLVFGIAGGVVLLAVVLVILLKVFSGDDDEVQTAEGQQTESVETLAVGGQETDGSGGAAAGSDTEEEVFLVEASDPLYSDVRPGVIDLNAITVTPGQKAPGMGWDSSLFYWLEDCDMTSDADGYLAKCRLTKTQCFAADTGETIWFEVYRDPESGVIHKIVSIRAMGSNLELVDYYYKDGKPNFIFRRTDSVYTPTYATTDKVGERYYFDNDVMVRWRMIREPGVIGEYVLTPGEVEYSQGDYYAENDELRRIYDETELNMLNRAYAVWNAVSADRGVGVLEGCVRDAAGNPISGATVNVFRRGENVLLYQMQTGEDGWFFCYVYLDASDCYLVVYADRDVYKPTFINDLVLAENATSHSYDRLVLHKTGGDDYPVHLDIFAANEAKTDENGSLNAQSLAGATVNFRSGRGMKEGTILLTAQAAGDGTLTANLPTGVYTAEICLDGYVTSYLEVEAVEGEAYYKGWVLPIPEQNQTAVVLTWEGEDTDLDLTVFTPYQSTGGDMAHVGGGLASDDRGNLLVADNRSGCEVVYLNTSEAGSFKIFVNDYTDSAAGSYQANRLATLNVHVYIYNVYGYVTEFVFPAGQSGVVWEVAEVNRVTVTPSQRVYQEVTGKRWWVAQKSSNVKKLLKRESDDFYGDIGWGSDGEYYYDAYGNMIAKGILEWLDGGIYRWTEYVYNDLQQLVSTISYGPVGRFERYPNVNSVEGREDYTYDEQGNKISASFYSGTELYSQDIYAYDERGNLLCETHYIEGTKRGETVYTYDGRGNRLSYVYYDSEGKKMYEYAYLYDEQGNQLSETHYFGDGTLNYETLYTYDQQGNKLSATQCESDGRKAVWTYDDHGNILSSQNDRGGTFWIYTYDDQGNVLTESRTSSDGYQQDTAYKEYTYDSQGNILLEKDYSNGEMTNEITYEYYDSLAEAAAAGERYLAGKTADTTGWKQAYIAQINAKEQEGHMYGYEYDLIYLDDDAIPELVIDEKSRSLLIYTYTDGQVRIVADDFLYGTWGNEYYYLPRTGRFMHTCYGFEGDEQVDYEDYFRINENYEFIEDEGEHNTGAYEMIGGCYPKETMMYFLNS